ncbi:MAG TPA: hypothetical protein VHG08_26970 [Longimicrobium sp.]|nr:hypothetical protein [Longimicrobium sp.]
MNELRARRTPTRGSSPGAWGSPRRRSRADVLHSQGERDEATAVLRRAAALVERLEERSDTQRRELRAEVQERLDRQ